MSVVSAPKIRRCVKPILNKCISTTFCIHTDPMCTSVYNIFSFSGYNLILQLFNIFESNEENFKCANLEDLNLVIDKVIDPYLHYLSNNFLYILYLSSYVNGLVYDHACFRCRRIFRDDQVSFPVGN